MSLNELCIYWDSHGLDETLTAFDLTRSSNKLVFEDSTLESDVHQIWYGHCWCNFMACTSFTEKVSLGKSLPYSPSIFSGGNRIVKKKLLPKPGTGHASYFCERGAYHPLLVTKISHHYFSLFHSWIPVLFLFSIKSQHYNLKFAPFSNFGMKNCSSLFGRRLCPPNSPLL